MKNGRWFSGTGEKILLVIALAGLLVLAVSVRDAVGSAVQIGGDEHFEVNKGLLWANGFPLYTRIWSDQPPLFTVLLGTLFKCFTPTIATARGLASCFGLIFLVGVFLLAKKRCGTLGGLVAAACVLASPYAFELSISVMQEVPAIGTALWSLLAMLRWTETRKWCWLAASGVLLAVAMQIKLTAAMVAPAIVAEMWIASRLGGKTSIRETFRAVLIWGGSASGAFLVLSCTLGSGGYDLLWATHHSLADDAERHAFPLDSLFEHAEVLWGAALGLAVLGWRREWRGLVIPIVLLATAFGVHILHRPWWYWYHIHFAVPLGWLTAYGVIGLWRGASVEGKKDIFRSLRIVVCLVAFSLMISAITVGGLTRLVSEVRRFQAIPHVEDSVLVEKMKEYSHSVTWVYARSSIYPFHAQLLVPPELAVLSLKRYWSGRITKEEIFRLAVQYQPQLLIDDGTFESDFKNLAESDYTVIHREGLTTLYVARSIVK